MLITKLHLKPGMRFAVANAPAGFALGALPTDVTQETSLRRDLDLVLLFALNQKALESRWPRALATLKPDGALWVSYPKKSSGIQSDLSMGEWSVTKGSGWNPVSMVSIDETWSAVRFKHAPGLDEERETRQAAVVRDADGTVCIDRKNRAVTPPDDLRQALDGTSKAAALFGSLAFTHRREYVTWILEAKKPETRAARISKTVELLSKGRKNRS